MAWSRSRCLARSLTRQSQHGCRRAAGLVRSSAAFAPCHPASFVNAIVVLYAVSALLGAVVYLPFRSEIRPSLERAGHWQALGLFDLKEHFVAIGLALLPAYWVCWQQQRTGEPSRTPAALTLILAFIVWWSFLIGHVLNNIMGFGL